MRLRDATPADAGAIVALLIATKESSVPELTDDHDRDARFWTDRWHRYLAEGSRAEMSRGDGFAILAEADGRLVGFAAYHHTGRHGAEAELESIYVMKEAQGRGVGTELLRTVAARLSADGSASLCVGYDSRNRYKRFYAKHGAVEVNPHWAVWRDLPALSRAAYPTRS